MAGVAPRPYGRGIGEGTHGTHDYVGPHGGNSSHARDILRKYGYNVRAAGPWTPRLHNAWQQYLNNTRIVGGPTGNEAAKAWNRTPLGRQLNDQKEPVGGRPSSMRGGPYRGSGGPDKAFISGHPGMKIGQRPKDTTIPDPVAAAHSHTKPKNKAAVHAKNLGAGAQHKVGGSGMPGVYSGGPSVNKLIPTSEAETLAGAQYDPQIREAKLQQLRQTADQAQAERDINDWSKQVQDSQSTATKGDTAAGAAVSGDVKNVIQGLIDSLGGSRGAGVIGAAGANDLTAIDQQGAAQNQFNQELAPILRNEQSTNLSRNRAAGEQAQEKLASALVDLQGQRGQAKAKALMDILTANNQARQSNFGNRLAMNNAILAAQSLGLKGDQLKAQLAGMGLQNRIAQAKLTAEQQQAKVASGHPNWAVLNPIDRRKLADQAVADAVKSLPAGVWDENHIMNQAYHNLRVGGYGSARQQGYKGKVPSRSNQVSIIGAIGNSLARARQQHAQGTAAAA